VDARCGGDVDFLLRIEVPASGGLRREGADEPAGHAAESEFHGSPREALGDGERDAAGALVEVHVVEFHPIAGVEIPDHLAGAADTGQNTRHLRVVLAFGQTEGVDRRLEAGDDAVEYPLGVHRHHDVPHGLAARRQVVQRIMGWGKIPPRSRRGIRPLDAVGGCVCEFAERQPASLAEAGGKSLPPRGAAQ
jgi:hypothetical protein